MHILDHQEALLNMQFLKFYGHEIIYSAEELKLYKPWQGNKTKIKKENTDVVKMSCGFIYNHKNIYFLYFTYNNVIRIRKIFILL